VELADTTAWAWSRRRAYPELRSSFDEALVDGRIATCDMVRLELLHSARDGAEFDQLVEELAALPDCPLGEWAWKRALDVYHRLAQRQPAFQRSVKHADLQIAAAAELAEMPLLHYDRDYELIAEVTGQPVRWLAEPGSLR
jgi:predicted nucleic acid-binding protein